MKTKISILCCVLFFLIISCQKDDENIDPIIGSWDLVRVSGGLMADQTYNAGDIVWTFSDDDVSIEDNLTNSDETTDYSLIEYGDSLYINFSSISSFFPATSYIEISDDEIRIDQNIGLIIMGNDTMRAPLLADALMYSFERQ